MACSSSLIALSIVVVAGENLTGQPWRGRRYVVLFFGLLHGQGFARALIETGLASGAFTSALLGFNLGVEVGQVAVAGALLAALLPIRSDTTRRQIARAGSALIALAGVYWAVERAFFPA